MAHSYQASRHLTAGEAVAGAGSRKTPRVAVGARERRHGRLGRRSEKVIYASTVADTDRTGLESPRGTHYRPRILLEEALRPEKCFLNRGAELRRAHQGGRGWVLIDVKRQPR
jgi:hypothetical protein